LGVFLFIASFFLALFFNGVILLPAVLLDFVCFFFLVLFVLVAIGAVYHRTSSLRNRVSSMAKTPMAAPPYTSTCTLA
jgi:hypothetical protein